MERPAVTRSGASSCWVFSLPALAGVEDATGAISGAGSFVLLLIFSVAAVTITAGLMAWALSPGGPAWANSRTRRGAVAIPGPRGLPFIGSILYLAGGVQPHRSLARMASEGSRRKELMAFSIGSTPAVVTSDPGVAKELLHRLSDRPLKQSARELMFGRAIGFAPNGAYWRLLRRIASSHLFSPRRVAAHEPFRRSDCDAMIRAINAEQSRHAGGTVLLRPHLQAAALNNIMGSVFGKRYDGDDGEAEMLQGMVREGFELLGAFNWIDHLPWLFFFDPSGVSDRCAALVPRVRSFVKSIIDDHKRRRKQLDDDADSADFVDVLLSLEGEEERLGEDDMIAVLWEMIFRGTDTTALLTEWVIAELVLNPAVQTLLRAEVDSVVAEGGALTDADVAGMPYLQAVVKEALRAHPPGPLLSWARLSADDVALANGMVVPAGTTAMVNMWAITHDPDVWARPDEFSPERFLSGAGGGGCNDVDVRGGDLRLAPFGAGRRVCPGKGLAMATVAMWVARLVQSFEWSPAAGSPVILDEVLRLSSEMKTPLRAAVGRR